MTNSLVNERDIKLFGKYVKDVPSLIDKHKISSAELRQAAEAIYKDFLSGNMSDNDFFWSISSLHHLGVRLSKGFGEVYKDIKVVQALRMIDDPVPYISNPTHEQMREMALKGATLLGLSLTKEPNNKKVK